MAPCWQTLCVHLEGGLICGCLMEHTGQVMLDCTLVDLCITELAVWCNRSEAR